MSFKRNVELFILKILEGALPNVVYDRLLIERRRRINHIQGYFPEAVFLSHKKSDIKYCIVRYTRPNFDLMAAGIQYVFCYHKLVERGYVPVIDIEYTYSFRQGRVGELNIWDECFEQPIPVKEIAKQPYVLATGLLFKYSDDPNVCLAINGDETDHFIHVKRENFREYYAKANELVKPIWKVKKELLEELDEEIWNKVRTQKVLGVFLRENFSKDVKYCTKEDEEVYNHHPLLPGVRETIEIINQELVSWEYDYILLSTMYKDSLEQFREVFGEKVLCIERERIYTDDITATNFSMGEQEEYEAYKNNISYYVNLVQTYLKEIVALSRCDYLLGGASSGMAAALTMNGGKYEDIYILKDEREIKRY